MALWVGYGCTGRPAEWLHPGTHIGAAKPLTECARRLYSQCEGMLAVHERQDVVHQGGMSVRKVALAAKASNAADLHRMLVKEHVVDGASLDWDMDLFSQLHEGEGKVPDGPM